MKKQKLALWAVLLMVLASPGSVKAYDFSAVAPSGQTLYYNIYSISGMSYAAVTYQQYDYYSSSYSNLVGSLIIPENVTFNGDTYLVLSVDTGAFEGCDSLFSVILPNTLQSIAPLAFAGCGNLYSVSLPDSLYSIGYAAFRDCSRLRSLVIPSHVQQIGDEAFVDYNVGYSTSTIWGGMPHIEYHGSATGSPWGAKHVNRHVEGDFVYTSPAKDTLLCYIGRGGNVAVPSGVEVIGHAAFFKSDIVTVTLPNSVVSLGSGVFASCQKLTSFTLPNTITTIPNSGFYGCTGLTALNIPSSVTAIQNYAFLACTGLVSLNLPNSITELGEGAFWRCYGLTSVVLPDSITKIPERAFSECYALTTFTFPSSVVRIESSAFSGCFALYDIVIPNSVYQIAEYAFNGVFHIEYHGGALGAPWGARFMNTRDGDFIFSNATRDTLMRYVGSGGSVAIPSTVRVIGNCAFYRDSTITEVTIPSQVEQIGLTNDPWGDSPMVFHSCTALTTVNFNAVNCRNADEEARLFRDCPLLTTLNIDEGVTLIDGAMFSGCRALSSLDIPCTVSKIGARAFENCIGIPSIHIPSSVTEIGDFAFYGCNFSTISVDNGNPAYDSRDNCNAIIETASSTLIRGCANTVIPNTIRKIGTLAFHECSELTSMTIPGSVSVLGAGAFMGCTGLTSIAMGNAIDSIGYFAFADCSSLMSIIIPGSVVYVGNNAFSGCSALDTVHFNAVDCHMHVINEDDDWRSPMFGDCGEFVLTIGEDVTKIPDLMFYDDPVRWDYAGDTCIEGPSFTLAAIISYATVPPVVEREAFYNTDRQIPLTVPCSAVDAYRANSAWNEFTNIQCMEVGIDEAAEADDARVWSAEGRIHIGMQTGLPVEARVYDVTGRCVATVAAGNEASVAVPAGVYLVRVGDLSAQRVVVVRN